MKNIILGTAGHIDHGKTSLIKALTGIDTDRLPEEKSRGITIELGFAHLDISPEIRIGIVDVPGHEKFVHHMVAGVGGIDLLLLVVAADEGVMPQTREHIEICELLGIKTGLVALTKIDLVEDDWLELVREDLETYLDTTFLKNAPVIPVSSAIPAGMDKLKSVLLELASGVAPKSADDIFRLPVDRVFTIRGFGTVVTGTVISGSAKIGDAVSLTPAGPVSRIRGLQVHDTATDVIFAGQRAAINLQGVDKEEIHRGMILCFPGEIPETKIIQGKFRLLETVHKPLKNRKTIRFHTGTSESLGQILLHDREILKPGETCYVQVLLDKMIAALPGDRFLIRNYSPVFTIGGGKILDAVTRKYKRYDKQFIDYLSRLDSPRLHTRILARIDHAGVPGISQSDLIRQFPGEQEATGTELKRQLELGAIIETASATPHLISLESWNAFKTGICNIISEYHHRKPLRPGILKEELRTTHPEQPEAGILNKALAELKSENRILIQEQLIKLPDFKINLTPDQKRLKQQLESIFMEAGYTGIKLTDVSDQIDAPAKDIESLFQLLLDQAELIRLPGGLIFHKTIMEDIIRTTRELIQSEGAITVGRFRDALGISRKQAVPLLEQLDRMRITRRSGDQRVLRDQEDSESGS